MKIVAINENGRRIGEDHPSAKMTNHEIDLMLYLHEEEGWGYQRLSDWTGCLSKSQVRNICKGRKRCQSPAGFKRIEDGE